MYRDYKLHADDFTIELKLRGKITVLMGNSATGKTFLYKLIQEIDNRDDIIYGNYTMLKNKGNQNEFIESIKRNKNNNKLYIIDQFDDIQRVNMEICTTINNDLGNAFIIIARAPKLFYKVSDLANVIINNKVIQLEYMFPEI